MSNRCQMGVLLGFLLCLAVFTPKASSKGENFTPADRDRLIALINEFRSEASARDSVEFIRTDDGLKIRSKFKGNEDFEGNRQSFDWEYEIKFGQMSQIDPELKFMRLTPEQVREEDLKEVLFDNLRILFVGDGNLHPYHNGTPFKPNKAQIEASTRFQADWQAGGSKVPGRVFAMATGLGKTEFARMAARYAHDAVPIDAQRILVITSQKEAGEQFESTFTRDVMTGFDPDEVMNLSEEGPGWKEPIGHDSGGNPIYRWADKEVVIATNMLMGREENLELFDPKYFDMIVIDEGHHAAETTVTYEGIKQHFSPRYLMALTATPFRGDNQNVVGWYGGEEPFAWSYHKAINHGYLVDANYTVFDDLSTYKLRDTGEVIDDRESGRFMETKFESSERDRYVVKKWLEKAREDSGRIKKSVFFAQDKAHARRIMAQLKKQGINAETYIDEEDSFGEKRREQDRQKLSRFRSGETPVLVTVNRFLEAVDVADIEMLVNVKRVQSLHTMLQMVGRGLRMAPGKRNIEMLDFMGNFDTVQKLTELTGVIGLLNSDQYWDEGFENPQGRHRAVVKPLRGIDMDEKMSRLVLDYQARDATNANYVMALWGQLYKDADLHGIPRAELETFARAGKHLAAHSDGKITHIGHHTLRRWFAALTTPGSGIETDVIPDALFDKLFELGLGERKSAFTILDNWVSAWEDADAELKEKMERFAYASREIRTDKKRLEGIFEQHKDVLPDEMREKIIANPRNGKWDPLRMITVINELFTRRAAQGLEGDFFHLKNICSALKNKKVPCTEKDLRKLITDYYYEFDMSFRLLHTDLRPEGVTQFLPYEAKHGVEDINKRIYHDIASYWTAQLKRHRFDFERKKRFQNFETAVEEFAASRRFGESGFTTYDLKKAYLLYSDLFDSRDAKKLSRALLAGQASEGVEIRLEDQDIMKILEDQGVRRHIAEVLATSGIGPEASDEEDVDLKQRLGAALIEAHNQVALNGASNVPVSIDSDVDIYEIVLRCIHIE